MTGSDEGERKVTGRRSRDSAIIPARESFYSDYFQFLAAIGRVLCANQPTRLADPVAGPLPRRSLGETERLTWTGKKKKEEEGRTGRTGTVKLSEMTKLFQYFIAATCHRRIEGDPQWCQEEVSADGAERISR